MVLTKRLIYLLIIPFLISIILTYGYLLSKHQFYLSDFTSFYSAAQILVKEPSNIYNFQLQKQYQFDLLPTHFINLPGNHFFPFINAPIILLPIIPLIIYSIQTAFSLYLVISIIIISFNLYLLTKIKPLINHHKILLSLICLAFAPTFITLFLGQNSFISLLIFIITYYLIKQKSWFFAGLAASTLLFKPQLTIVLFPYLFIRGSRTLKLGLTIGTIMFFLISILLTQGHFIDLFKSMATFIGHPSNYSQVDISWLGFFTRIQYLIGHLPINIITIVISIITISTTLLIIIKIPPHNSRFPLVYSLIIITTLLTGLHIHTHEAVLLFLPLFIYFRKYHSSTLNLAIISGWLVFFLHFLFAFTPLNLYFPFFFPTVYLLVIYYLSLKQLISIKLKSNVT